MQFRNADITDLDFMMRLVRRAVDDFKEAGIDQWQKGYPNAEILTEDIQKGRSYVLEESGDIVGMLCILPEPDPSYAHIDGAWLTDLPYASFHRVCVDGGRRGHGLAGLLFAEAEKKSRKLGFQAVRIDTHEDNRAMRRAVAKQGYAHCGTIRLVTATGEMGDLRLAYEKKL